MGNGRLSCWLAGTGGWGSASGSQGQAGGKILLLIFLKQPVATYITILIGGRNVLPHEALGGPRLRFLLSRYGHHLMALLLRRLRPAARRIDATAPPGWQVSLFVFLSTLNRSNVTLLHRPLSKPFFPHRPWSPEALRGGAPCAHSEDMPNERYARVFVCLPFIAHGTTLSLSVLCSRPKSTRMH